jgi:protein phosphatase
VIVRALGMKPAVDVDLGRVALARGDVLLLCSDGLSGMVPDARLAELVRAAHGDLRLAAQTLVDAANAAGGVDNATCVLVGVG